MTIRTNAFRLGDSLQSLERESDIFAAVRDAFEGSGFVPLTSTNHLQVSRSIVVGQVPLGRQSVSIGAFTHFEWTVERLEEAWYAVVLPRTMFMSHSSISELSPFAGAFELAVRNVETGRSGRVSAADGYWFLSRWDKSERVRTPGVWRLTFSMMELKSWGLSEDASRISQKTFDEITRDARKSPVAHLLDPNRIYEPASSQLISTDGEHLQFATGQSSEMKKVLRLGAAVPSHHAVEVGFALPAEWSDDKRSEVKEELLALWWDKAGTYGPLAAARRRLRLEPGHDTIESAWKKFGLPPYSLSRQLLAFDKHGQLVSQPTVSADVRSIFVCVHDGELPDDAHNSLMGAFKGIGRVVPVQRDTLGQKYARLNVAAEIARKAGAELWRLRDLPGASKGTVFLGLDSGSDHQRRNQQLVATAFADDGSELTQPKKFQIQGLSERIPSEVLVEGIPRWLARSNSGARHLIIHRDGRFLEGETDDLEFAFQALSLALVNVKKRSLFRTSPMPPGAKAFRLCGSRAIVVTNDQAERGSCPDPLEIELIRGDGLSMDDVVSQIFWLARVDCGLFHAKRLPVTIERANNCGSLGRRAHRKSFKASQGRRSSDPSVFVQD
jgi:hypothetical protein